MIAARKLEPLDIAVRVAFAAVLVVLAYIGYTAWSQSQAVKRSAPSSRVVGDLADRVRAKPNDAGLRNLLGEALAADGDLNGAVDQFNTALQLDEKNTRAMQGLGLVAMKRGEFKTADGYWRKVIDTLQGGDYASSDTRLEAAYYYLGTTLIELKEPEEAAGYLKEALRIRRTASDSHYMLSVAYKMLGSPDKQLDELQITLILDPNMPEANYDLGLLLQAEGKLAEAAERFRLSADNARANEKPLAELKRLGDAGEWLDKAKASRDASKALDAARIASALDPNNKDAVRLLAKGWEQAGKKEKALAAWERLMMLAPDDAEGKAALERLGTNAGK